MDVEIVSHSVEETIGLGRCIGGQLRGGEVFAVCGPLGSGKTHLIKGIAAGAGADDGAAVSSPTFVLVNQYSGRLDLYHIDAYRVESIGEFEMLGFDDYCYPESVVLIEWADKVQEALQGAHCVQIELAHAGETTRRVRIRNMPSHVRIERA